MGSSSTYLFLFKVFWIPCIFTSYVEPFVDLSLKFLSGFVVLFLECEPGSVRSALRYFIETAKGGNGLKQQQKQSIFLLRLIFNLV